MSWRPTVKTTTATALLLVVLTGAATAAHFARGGPDGLAFVRAKDGFLVVLDAGGRAHKIWHCRRPDGWCGDLAGIAWSRDGRRLALSTGEVAARSTYPGLHIFDLKTGADRRIPRFRASSNASLRTLRREVATDTRRLGCSVPTYLSWAPDGSQLAYSCLDASAKSPRHWRTLLYSIQPGSTGRSVLSPAHFGHAYGVTWSPDSLHIAFSTCELPLPRCNSSVFVVSAFDGSGLRRLGAGSLPDWSPGRKTIAYVARVCGRARIKLVTPDGRDVTPAVNGCRGIGPSGSLVPAWSPDGGRIAVATRQALYVMNADGSGLQRLLRGNFSRGPGGGFLRPLWQPRAKGGTS